MINVYLGGSLPTRGSIVGAPIDWITAVRLEAIARGDASTTGDQAALALHQKAWERLFGTPSLDGLVMDMEPGAIVSDEDEADTQIGVVTGTAYYLTGCNQALVAPTKLKEDGSTLDSHWYDFQRLERVDAPEAGHVLRDHHRPLGPRVPAGPQRRGAHGESGAAQGDHRSAVQGPVDVGTLHRRLL